MSLALSTLLLAGCTLKHPVDAPDAFVDRQAYPFEDRWLDVDGGRMHYLDEGEGPVVLLVHGTPTWSFLWRDLVQDLSVDHRVIAMDHIGFGLSDKPADWTYTPAAHSENVEALVQALDLDEITLVVHDFGGPIGLGAGQALQDRIDRVVILNTWLWSLEDDPDAARISKVVAGPVGRFLYLERNFSTRRLIPWTFADKDKLTDEVHDQYVDVFADPDSRVGHWRLGIELVGSSAWYDEQWAQRDWLAERPVLLGWGMQDPTFGPEELDRWTEALPQARVVRFEESGHFVQEEAPAALRAAVRDFVEADGLVEE